MSINAQSVGAAFWLVFAAFLFWAGYDLGVGRPNDPGAGFLIFWSGVLIALFAAWILVESLRETGASLASVWEGVRWGKVAIAVVGLILYAAALSVLGFLLATSLLMLLLLRAIDPVPWARAIAVALAATFGVWWVLERVLSVRLPDGLLG